MNYDLSAKPKPPLERHWDAITALRARVDAIEKHPALSVPALEPTPAASAEGGKDEPGKQPDPRRPDKVWCEECRHYHNPMSPHFFIEPEPGRANELVHAAESRAVAAEGEVNLLRDVLANIETEADDAIGDSAKSRVAVGVIGTLARKAKPTPAPAQAEKAEQWREAREQALTDAAKQVCPHCAGHTPPYRRPVDGPNEAGNYTHERYSTGESTMCKASGIWSLIRYEKAKAAPASPSTGGEEGRG